MAVRQSIIEHSQKTKRNYHMFREAQCSAPPSQDPTSHYPDPHKPQYTGWRKSHFNVLVNRRVARNFCITRYTTISKSLTLHVIITWRGDSLQVGRSGDPIPVEARFSALFNPLNPELNPICYLLALLGVHHFLHVSRIRIKSLTLRRLMSYIYIYIWSTHSWCF